MIGPDPGKVNVHPGIGGRTPPGTPMRQRAESARRRAERLRAAGRTRGVGRQAWPGVQGPVPPGRAFSVRRGLPVQGDVGGFDAIHGEFDAVHNEFDAVHGENRGRSLLVAARHRGGAAGRGGWASPWPRSCQRSSLLSFVQSGCQPSAAFPGGGWLASRSLKKNVPPGWGRGDSKVKPPCLHTTMKRRLP